MSTVEKNKREQAASDNGTSVDLGHCVVLRNRGNTRYANHSALSDHAGTFQQVGKKYTQFWTRNNDATNGIGPQRSFNCVFCSVNEGKQMTKTASKRRAKICRGYMRAMRAFM